MSEILISQTRNQKKWCAWFAYVSSSLILCFHKCNWYSLIVVLFHVERIFIALQCQMCGTYFKKRQGITKHFQIKHYFFFASHLNVSRFQIFFYKIQKIWRTLWTSIITTNGINFLIKNNRNLNVNFLCSYDSVSIDTGQFITKAQFQIIEPIQRNVQQEHKEDLFCDSCRLMMCT